MMTLLAMKTALAGDPLTLEAALKQELDRAMASLKLPDAPAPYLIHYDIVDGQVATVQAAFGYRMQVQVEDYRSLRAEVRVGSYQADSSNFRSLGDPDGVVGRRLPVEDSLLALRREVWLATDEAYKYAVEQLSRKMAARAGDERPRPPDLSQVPPVDVPFAGQPVAAMDPARLVQLAERLSGELKGLAGLETAEVMARDWQGRRLTLSSEGSRIWRSTGFTVLRVEGVVRLSDGSKQRDVRWWVVKNMQELPPEEEMVASVRDLRSWLGSMKDAAVEEDYLGPVLFEQSAAVELFAQLLPPELIGTPQIEEEQSDGSFLGLRVPTARLGRRLLPVGWSVVDDPTQGHGMGSYELDLEGVPASRVEVVHDGVVRDLLMSRIPSREHPKSTGHGRFMGNDRRGAMTGVVTVRPNRMVSRKALIKRAFTLAKQVGRDYVLVVRRIEPLTMVEQLEVAVSGESQLSGLSRACEVYRLYRDGRTEPVRPLEFVGVDRRILRDIDRAGPMIGPVDMLDAPPGPDRYQVGPTGGIGVTWSAPEVLITELELVSHRGGETRILKL